MAQGEEKPRSIKSIHAGPLADLSGIPLAVHLLQDAEFFDGGW